MNWELLLRYINDEGTAEERAALDAWLNQKPENKIILRQLQLKQKQLAQPVKTDVIHSEWLKVLDRVLETPKPQAEAKIKTMFRLFGIAAALMVVFCITWYTFRGADNSKDQPVIVKTTTERRQIQLPDGSLVYLAPNSRLVVNGRFGKQKREISLNGEAFFDVKHDAKKSFIVNMANNLKVNVLGTSFNVYSRVGTNPEVKVATGLVGVVHGKTTTFLKAGDKLNYLLPNKQAIRSRVDIHDASSLQNGTLYFNNSNAAEIARKITRYYNIKVDVAASAHKHHRFSGEMKDYGVTKLLDGLRFATGIKYKINNQNSILLY